MILFDFAGIIRRGTLRYLRIKRFVNNNRNNARLANDKLGAFLYVGAFDSRECRKLPETPNSISRVLNRTVSNTKNYLQDRVNSSTSTAHTANQIEMTTNSSYIRAINDYTISSHQIFTDAHGAPPTASVIFNIKDSPFSECDRILADITEYMNRLNIQRSGVADVRFFDDEDEKDSYSVYRQLAGTFTSLNTTVVVEILGAPEVVTVTVLTNDSASLDGIVQLLEQNKTKYKTVVKERKDKTFYTISSSSHGFELEELSIKGEYAGDMVFDNYNDDFVEVDEVIKNSIDFNKKGLILLHGIPGSGKTSYIKHLITGSSKRKIVYVPTHLTAAIASPNFISFVKSELSNSVLVIEDAEQVLLSRENPESYKEAVSNILNMTDGILADALNILIICTFNTDMENLDKALLRKGRLLLQYKFDELNKEKADLLCEKLYGKKVGKSMPLSEIYNLDYDLIKPKEKPRVQFGFTK